MSRGGPLGLLLLLGALGCESNAFSLSDPTGYTATLDPDYLEGDTTQVLELIFDGVPRIDDTTGDPTTWQVVALELDGLYLEGFRFVSNFRVELELAARLPECGDAVTSGCERAALGTHDLVLQISNHYGTFTLEVTALVFP